MRLANLVFVIPFALGAPLLPVATPSDPPGLIESNDNTREAGTLSSGVLTVRLEAKVGELRPEGAHNPSVTVYAFGEEGKALQAPGPQIRVVAGTRVHVTLRNSLPKKMIVRGLNARPGLDSLDLAPGEVREITFTPATPGTYFYWGRTDGQRAGQGFWNDGQLAGALIVDPVGPRHAERVMVITNWGDLSDTLRPQAAAPVHMMVNGRSWPYTERMTYQTGDSVFWRVINATTAAHPMHLHGFYFRVDSRGSAGIDTTFTPAHRRQAVTELMERGTTMTMAWSPDRSGNWLFHCHFIEHISPDQRLGELSTIHSDLTHGMHKHAYDGMSGLVTGVIVLPSKRAPPRASAGIPAKKLDLFVNQRPYFYGASPAYSFVLQQGRAVPARDSIRIPGSPIILTRGVPTEITVHNRTSEMVTVHWHGIELDSFYDGVGDWSGSGSTTAPPIAPDKSFVVKYTPGRAGTFIYHSHTDEAKQLSSGMYGALIVLEPGQQLDAETDRIMLLAAGGPKEDSPPMINGALNPPPLELSAGKLYRFRFIDITPSGRKAVRVLNGKTVQLWRAFAKDGALLPPAQATIQPAEVTLGSGETYDFEFTPARPGGYRMEVITLRRGFSPLTNVVAINVK